MSLSSSTTHVRDRTLHLAAFDHRRSLDKALAELAPAPDRQLDRLEAKQMIWRGIRQTSEVTNRAAVLVDADAGLVLDAARDSGVTTAMALERSGQRWLAPERPARESAALLARHRPNFAKLLVRWHPDDEVADRQAQVAVIRELALIGADEGAALMLELLVPADHADAPLFSVAPDVYHDEVLPVRLADAIRQLSDADVVPDMWKIDGLPRANACKHVAAAVREGSDGSAGIVVLGAGKDLETVSGWFRATAGQNEFCGFAIGRTIWWEPVRDYVTGRLGAVDAEREIGERFARVVDAYRAATAAS